MYNITYRAEGNYIVRETTAYPLCKKYVDIYNEPTVGQKYWVVFYCDYSNTEHGLNYIVEVTEENIAEITYHMNDLENDITEYVLISE